MSSRKRPPAADAEAPQLERLELTPLGGGNEVGRSCLILRYKGKTIMLDCGVLPSFHGLESLPWLGEITPSEIDIVFITHFHLDHAAALPHFTERLAGFRGRIFATHATIACMKLMLSDFVRVTGIASAEEGSSSSSAQLYSEADIDRCIARMEAVDFKQRMRVDGVGFMFFNAGHVLGAAMVLMEIAGVRVLYTGDYSCEEDRHLMAADLPTAYPPDVLIVEATYGMQVHESKAERERRFTETVEKVVLRGGRCLVPVFALGRAQELLLILDELWAAKPELQHIPIYFSSRLASRSLDVYRTYVSYMNARIQTHMGDRNPWDFRFVKSLSRPDEFKDDGPCVVLASPGMLQSGFSRSLFDRWCEDYRNGVVLAGYSVEGTLARRLENNPSEVESITNRKLARRITVERVSFAAHADSLQTAAFVEALAPPCIILVHGERSEMRRLRDGLAKKFEGGAGAVQVFMPPNGATVSMEYAESRVVKAMGSLAARRLTVGTKISGVLVHRNFEYLLVAPSDLPLYTPLASHSLAQKLHVPFRGDFKQLRGFVCAMYEDVIEGFEPPLQQQQHTSPPSSSAQPSSSPESSARRPAQQPASSLPRQFLKIWSGTHAPPQLQIASDKLQLASGPYVTLVHAPPDRVLLTWSASPVSDAVADSLVALIAQTEVSQSALRSTTVQCGHGSHSSSGHDGHEHSGDAQVEVDENRRVHSGGVCSTSSSAVASSSIDYDNSTPASSSLSSPSLSASASSSSAAAGLHPAILSASDADASVRTGAGPPVPSSASSSSPALDAAAAAALMIPSISEQDVPVVPTWCEFLLEKDSARSADAGSCRDTVSISSAATDAALSATSAAIVASASTRTPAALTLPATSAEVTGPSSGSRSSTSAVFEDHGPSLRRRDALLDVLCAQYGPDAVIYIGAQVEVGRGRARVEVSSVHAQVEVGPVHMHAVDPAREPHGADLIAHLQLQLVSAPTAQLQLSFALAVLLDESVGVLAWCPHTPSITSQQQQQQQQQYERQHLMQRQAGIVSHTTAQYHSPVSLSNNSSSLNSSSSSSTTMGDTGSKPGKWHILLYPALGEAEAPIGLPFWVRLPPSSPSSLQLQQGRGSSGSGASDGKFLSSLRRTAAYVDALFEPTVPSFPVPR